MTRVLHIGLLCASSLPINRRPAMRMVQEALVLAAETTTTTTAAGTASSHRQTTTTAGTSSARVALK
jgi:hypothetical protein